MCKSALARSAVATALLSTTVLLGSCATVPDAASVVALHDRADADGGDEMTASAERVVAEARRMVGLTTLSGSRYALDCSGLVLHIHERAGVSLDEPFARAAGNGVARLHAVGAEAGLLVESGAVRPGDVLFWDNSYDRNEDGLWNDPFTHTGIAVDVAADGTIIYLHHHYSRGVVEARMNVRSPDDTAVNSPMRMKGQRTAGRDEYLSSHLFRGAARLHELGR